MVALVQHPKATLVDWLNFSIAVYLQQANTKTVSNVLDEYTYLTKNPDFLYTSF